LDEVSFYVRLTVLPFAFWEHRFRLILDTPDDECYVGLTEIGVNFADFRLIGGQFACRSPKN
jgi:hypothetical protein